MTETNNTLKTLGWIFSGFVAGFAVSQFLSKDSIFSDSSIVEQCTSDQWQQIARSSDWTPKNECPAYPLRLSIASPGDQSRISLDQQNPTIVRETVVVALSRPLPEGKRLYLAAQEVGAPNLYVSRSKLYSNASGTAASTIGPLYLGFDLSKAGSIQIWAFATDDDNRIGDLYRDVHQLQDGTQNVYISDPVQLNITQSTPPG